MLGVSALGALAVLSAPAHADTTIAVTAGSSDAVANDAICSLREAITTANTNTAGSSGCVRSGSGAEVVSIPAGTYTVALRAAAENSNASGDFDIAGSVTIEGAGAQATIVDGDTANAGANFDRVFDVQSGTVAINKVTVRNGKASTDGGGIRNLGSGALSLDDDVIKDNAAGTTSGVLPGAGGGGGVASVGTGTMTVSDTTFSGNDAGDATASGITGGDGGGLLSITQTTVTTSTFVDNTGGDGLGGSGVPNGDHGGAIAIAQSPASGFELTLTNSTLVNNSAGAGTFGQAGGHGGAVEVLSNSSANMTNNTFSGNAAGAGSPAGSGGAVRVAGSATATLTNNILASSGDNCGFAGTATDGGHNISFGGSPNGCPGGFATGDPGLGSLQDNGGPTQTMTISSTGAAYDQGAAGCPATDQRGITRNQGASCDIGALELRRFGLTAAKSGLGSGTVTSSVGGINCGATCSATYDEGTSVTLTATQAANSTFTGWSGAGCSGTGNCVTTINAAKTATANFDVAQRNLSVTKAGSGGGSVTSAPAGINCGGICNANYDHGTPVTLTANQSAGSTFTGWSGAGCSGTGTCNVTMDAAKSVTATFTALRTLTVTKAGSGSGAVTSAPAGINCGAVCANDYTDGTPVTLTANPAAGSAFTGWSGAGCSGTGTCTTTMDVAKSVTATFAVVLRTLTVTATGLGSGTVTSSPAGIDCGSNCSAQFSDGTSVTLTAHPASNSTFDGWTGGGCSGTDTCTVALGSDIGVGASFQEKTVPGPPLGKPPDTTILKAKVKKTKGSAKFIFGLAGKEKAVVSFECALVKKKGRTPKFKACTSPVKYKHLKPRKYLFEVRAVNEAGADPTPATKRFKIK